MVKRRSEPPHEALTLFAKSDPLPVSPERGGGPSQVDPGAPLAERMRPRSLAEMLGQGHLIGEGSFLARAIAEGRPPSMILWGPPGTGKTTLARLIAETIRGRFVPFSAVLGGVPELRIIIAEAARAREREAVRTVLFIDEIHRFHKGQQDAFLPHVENGTITLVGATTENPSFSINAALLSRSRVFHLTALSELQLMALLQRALDDSDRGLGGLGLQVETDALRAIARGADGDARRALVSLDVAAQHAVNGGGSHLTLEAVQSATGERTLLYDKSGEEHYNVVSAFIKSMRGSDPDAAIYYMFRMLDAGDDPLFVLRRMVIFASEDIGNADPRAITVAVDADQAFRRMGMPEGLYPLAHACLYLASAPKSDGVKRAIAAAQRAIREHGPLPVPFKLRNAPTRLMKQEGYGEGYDYPHDHQGHAVPGETYLPEPLIGSRFYEPTQEGLEKAIGERLARLRTQRPS